MLLFSELGFSELSLLLLSFEYRKENVFCKLSSDILILDGFPHSQLFDPILI